LSRKTSMTDPDMGAWTYVYDANGNLTSQTDARGRVINFQYDNLDRLVTKLPVPSGE
jgi:YD repeat-containing protein